MFRICLFALLAILMLCLFVAPAPACDPILQRTGLGFALVQSNCQQNFQIDPCQRSFSYASHNLNVNYGSSSFQEVVAFDSFSRKKKVKVIVRPTTTVIVRP
jgi:hypothetical protein